MMASVLLVAPMPIGSQRTGPGIRFLELARVLAGESRVTLLLPEESSFHHPGFAVQSKHDGPLESLLDTHEIVIVQGPALQEHPGLVPILGKGRHYLVVDLYDPITLELLEVDRTGQVGRWVRREYTALLNEQLRLGDFFICASERQRDYWIGALSSLGRINHDTYDGAGVRQLIDVVPFGLPAEKPKGRGPALKGVLPGIAPEDRVILWGGGLWDWLDPLTPIRAIQRMAALHHDVRLVFFEWEQHHPAMHHAAKQLAAELSLLDRHVFIAPWLPPEQWASCLLEADVGLVFHPASIETHFAFRTRVLDYVWAGLPIVTAAGDVMSELVVAHELGHVVAPADEDGLVEALTGLLEETDARGARRARFQAVAESFVWEKVVWPLVHYCRQPQHAGDKAFSLAEHWEAAEQDRRLSEVAHAERLRLEAERQQGLGGAPPNEPNYPPNRNSEPAGSQVRSTLARWPDWVRRAFRKVRRKPGRSLTAREIDGEQKRSGNDRHRSL
jgi:glycosyltransferase involved in cell wall biosynthesis